MVSLPKRFIYALSNKIRRKNSEFITEKKLIYNFAKIKKSPFEKKSESSNDTCLDACLSNNSYLIGLKKTNCISWVKIPGYEFLDHVIEAKIRLDSMDGYASAGLLFRITDDTSYYMALVSSKGYFRLDAVKDNIPKTLIAWTEISNFDGININLNIVTCGAYLIFIVNGKWIGEINDDSLSSGQVGFAIASYSMNNENAAAGSSQEKPQSEINKENNNVYSCKAYLDCISVDTRAKAIGESHKKWTNDSNINAENRLRLAEAFASTGESSKALDQMIRAWKRRDDAIRSVTSTYTEVRTRKELLLASRLSFRLGQYREAEEYIDAVIEQWSDDPVKLINFTEVKEAFNEKIIVLNELDKFRELKEFALKYSDIINKDINYYTMLARSHLRLNEYEASASAWNMAFKMNNENGVYAANAANALELAGKKAEALALFMEAGRIFLLQDNVPELTALIPKLTSLGSKNWEARALAGKWAFSVEDYKFCEAECTASEKLRSALKPKPKADPALYYLWGIVLNLKGKNANAVSLLKKAVKLAPDYGLFRFKLAEIRITGGEKNPELAKELRIALDLIGSDPGGKMADHAGKLLLSMGDKKSAKYFIDRSKK
ncbi:MAG: hypothetical protein FWC03_03425 [Treponema sp.]|nr:hypothetical protein [Treponema sp.]